MDQSLNHNASVLKHFFPLINHTTVPEPCIPTQSQVEEEHVCRVQVWVVCWGRKWSAAGRGQEWLSVLND